MNAVSFRRTRAIFHSQRYSARGVFVGYFTGPTTVDDLNRWPSDKSDGLSPPQACGFLPGRLCMEEDDSPRSKSVDTLLFSRRGTSQSPSGFDMNGYANGGEDGEAQSDAATVGGVDGVRMSSSLASDASFGLESLVLLLCRQSF